MDRLLIISKIVAMFAISLLTLSLIVLVFRADATLTKINTFVDSADGLTERADLLLKQSSYLILNVGLTANQIRKASVTQAAELDILNAHVERTLIHVDAFVVNADHSQVQIAATTNETIKQIQPVLAEASTTLVGVQEAVSALDKLITDPSIPKTLLALQESSVATASTMVSVSKTTSELQGAIHSYLHPSWLRSTATWGLRVAQALNPF
jgi:hypothetical protein